MSRFGENSSKLIDQAIKGFKTSKPANTIKTHNYVARQFRRFCEHRNFRLDNSKTNQDIADILKDWALNMRKSNGDDYKEGVVKTLWNMTANMVQQQYFEKYNRVIDPFKDDIFVSARNARNAKRRNLRLIPEKRKSSSVALTRGELDKIVELFDEETPDGLQRKFYHIAAVQLRWRGAEATASLVYYFKEGADRDRIEYNRTLSKTSQGGNYKTTDSKWLAVNVENKNLCPVRLLRKMLSKRTSNIKTNRLFITPNKDWKKYKNSPWYKNTPLGRNTISKWTKLAAATIGLDTKTVKITNHSNRLTVESKNNDTSIDEDQNHITQNSSDSFEETKPQISFLNTEDIFDQVSKNNGTSVVEDQNYITQNSSDSFEETKPQISFVNSEDIFDQASKNNDTFIDEDQNYITQNSCESFEDTKPQISFLNIEDDIFDQASKNNDTSVNEDQNYITQNSSDSFEETKPQISFGNTEDIFDTSPTKKRKKQTLDHEHVEELLEDPIEVLPENTKGTQKDICELYCNLLAAKLRCFENKTRDILMNEIDNIVFRFKMKESEIK